MFIHEIRNFFASQCILYLALGYSLGVSFALTVSFIFPALGVLLFIFAFNKRISIIFILFFILGTAIAYPRRVVVPSDLLPLKGEAILAIDHIKQKLDPLTKAYIGQGKIKSFDNKSLYLENKPCTILLNKNPHIVFDHYYKVPVTLLQSSHHKLLLRVDKRAQWNKLHCFFTLNKWRHKQKKSMEHWIQSHTKDRHCKGLFHALLIGEQQDLLVFHFFQKLGLQHLLAISGFHFGMISMLLCYLFGKLMPKKISLLFVIGFIAFYFLYLGFSPSILRAFVASSFGLLGSFFHMRAKPLNFLGLALFLNLLFFPLDIFHIGFQLSYAATFAIIISLPLLKPFIDSIQTPSKTLKAIQIGFLGALFINITTSLLTLPILLFHFHHFPLISFIYNQFAPVAITIIMSMLCISALLFFLTPLVKLLFGVNEFFTRYFLKTLFYYPRKLDIELYFFHLSSLLALLLFTFLSLLLIFLLQKNSSSR